MLNQLEVLTSAPPVMASWKPLRDAWLTTYGVNTRAARIGYDKTVWLTMLRRCKLPADLVS